MIERHYTIVVAAAGTRLNDCTRNIQAYLDPPGKPNVGTDIVRVASLLRNPIQREGSSRITFGGDIDIRELMTHARPSIEASWNDALKQSISCLNPHSEYPAIACHLTTFDIETKVFCSPGRIDSFTVGLTFDRDDLVWSPSRVVILIDDIYDMYADLSTDGDVLGRGDRVSKAASRLEGLGLKLKDFKSLAELDADISGLKTVLAWRRAEMIQAEYLANQLGVPLICLGTKHSMPSARLALSRGTAPVVYISHPITRYRNELAESKGTEWSVDTRALNDFCDTLGAVGIVGIMPTAIDELRFSPRPSRKMEWQPLTPRWPRIASASGLIGYPLDAHGRDAAKFSDIPSLHVNNKATDIAGTYLRTLESLVFDDIPFRDHFLVNNSSHLLVFRPRAGGKPFSGGVKQEIAFWAELLKAQPHRRIAIVHKQSDLSIILREFQQALENSLAQSRGQDGSKEDRDEHLTLLRRSLSTVVESAKKFLQADALGSNGSRLGASEFTHRMKMKYNDELATEILYRGDVEEYEGPLLEAVRKHEAAALQGDAWRNAIAPKIERSLTYLNVSRENCRVFVFETLNEGAARRVASWLSGLDVPVVGDTDVNSMISSAVEDAAVVVAECEGIHLHAPKS